MSGRASTPRAFEDARLDRHRRDEGHAEAVVDHLDEGVQRRAHHRRLGAQLRPVAGGQRMVLQAVAVLEQQQAVLVDRPGVDARAGGRLAAREGDEQPVVEQGRLVDVAAAVGQGEQDAVELAAVERVAGGLAGLLAQEELEVRPLRAEPRKHRRQQERARWSG